MKKYEEISEILMGWNPLIVIGLSLSEEYLSLIQLFLNKKTNPI